MCRHSENYIRRRPSFGRSDDKVDFKDPRTNSHILAAHEIDANNRSIRKRFRDICHPAAVATAQVQDVVRVSYACQGHHHEILKRVGALWQSISIIETILVDDAI
jgi:hypothetical protein